jgi:NADH-quinone oxidoreductase subunit J
MVLFLFVVMMLDIRIDAVRRGFWKHFPFAALIGAVIAFEMGMVLMGGFGDVEDAKAVGTTMVNAAGQTVPYSNTQALGKLLYTEYLYPVEIAAVILLVAMIAAIALTLRKRKDSKAMNPADQVRVRASDRIKLVKIDSTKPAQNLTLKPRLQRLWRQKHDAHFGPLPDAGRHAVCAVGGRHLSEPQEPDRLADGHRADAAGGEHELRRLLHYLGDMHGQVFVFFILTVAAAESAIGLAILVLLFRNKTSIDAEDLNALKG